MTTMFVSVSNDLPRTSYIKMVDIWLVFNLLIPFVEVLLNVYKVTSRMTSIQKTDITSCRTPSSLKTERSITMAIQRRQHMMTRRMTRMVR